MTHRKISFRLSPDADGYPPFDTENIWATETIDQDHYVLDNIPFFATQATIGDVVNASRDGAGRLIFHELITRSPRSLLRVVVHDAHDIDEVRAELKRLGCSTEAFAGRPILAVDVPCEVDLPPVQAYLADLEQRDLADYEEPILRHPG